MIRALIRASVSVMREPVSVMVTCLPVVMRLLIWPVAVKVFYRRRRLVAWS